MKTVFDQTTRDELITRINGLNENSTAQWGKMTVYQMAKHCRMWDEWVACKTKNKQVFIGKVFGKLALKSVLKDESPIRRNSPTIPELVITDSGDLAAEKATWSAAIKAYAHFSNPGFVHTFFWQNDTRTNWVYGL